MKTGKTLGSLLLTTFAALLAFSLSGCSKDVLDYRNAQGVNGKIYKGDSDKPFSGIMTNVPDNEILQHQDGFAQIAELIVRGADPREVPAAQGLGISWVGMLTVKTTAYCEVPVSNGLFDGEAACKAPRSDEKTTIMNFKGGRLDGKLRYYDTILSPNLLAEASFNEYGANGTLKVYSPKTGKVVRKADFEGGQYDGDKEIYNENGDLIFKAKLKKGKLEGETVEYSPDGKNKVDVSHWSNDMRDGDQDKFDPATGKKVAHGDWSNGKLNGKVQQWDTDGKLISEKEFKEGQEVPQPVPPAPVASPAAQMPAAEVDACVKHWINAFHKEQGQDAMIAADQLDEWNDWCKQGKQAPSA